MIILAIDTSFDDTAAAVVRDRVILSNILSSQLDAYQQWGGVIPSMARSSHQRHIHAVIEKAVLRAQCIWDDIDALAVTYGPGLAIALEVGIETAQELATLHTKPLYAVNHMEGHLLSVFAQRNSKNNLDEDISSYFPAMGVLISGGHTQFIYVKEIGSYSIIGETKDDAMGEAFDKCGRMLGLGYPAGKLVEQMAKLGTPKAVTFPVPMRHMKTPDMSFSGLKAAAMRMIEPIEQAQGTLTKSQIANMSLAFQTSCVAQLTERLSVALDQYSVKSILVGGGVAANQTVRKQLRLLARQQSLKILFPITKKLCTDNAAMIGIAGVYVAQRSKPLEDICNLHRAPNLRIGT